MKKDSTCSFCDTDGLAWRTIKSSEHFTSLVSNPAFREGHCLVIPNQHVAEIAELDGATLAPIMQEIGRLSKVLDKGYGSGVMQKFQPTQSDNGIKMSHLHFHVFPRLEHETTLFPVPNPNNFDGFFSLSDDQVTTLAQSLR